MIRISPQEAKEAYYRVFQTLDQFGTDLFVPKLKSRILLCSTRGFNLTRRQYDALIRTLQEMPSEDYFLLSPTHVHTFCDLDLNGKVPCHQKCPADFPFQEFCEFERGINSCLYSPNGNWGIIPSFEWSAALGGTTEFVEKYKKHYPAWRYGIGNFVEYWKDCEIRYKTDITWTEKYLEQFERDD